MLLNRSNHVVCGPRDSRYWIHLDSDGLRGQNSLCHASSLVIGGELLDISPEVISRIKVLARMDIAERRMPQDGQLTLSPEGNLVHLRASSFPA